MTQDAETQAIIVYDGRKISWKVVLPLMITGAAIGHLIGLSFGGFANAGASAFFIVIVYPALLTFVFYS